MPKKLPYFPFYTGDWLKDPKLSLCTSATRGVWIDLICAMHELDRSGELRGTADQLARTARCSTVEFVQAMTDIQTTGAADVTERNGEFQVRNRRMYAESNARKSAAERQMRHRHACRNGPDNGPPTPIPEDEIESAFEEFWEQYPKGRKNSKGAAREAFRRALGKVEAATILAAVREYAASDVGREGRWVKMPSTWLNQECWTDDRDSWRNRDGKPEAPKSEYSTIPPELFSEYYHAQRFKAGPYCDKPKDGTQRWYGELVSNSKVQTFRTAKKESTAL